MRALLLSPFLLFGTSVFANESPPASDVQPPQSALIDYDGFADLTAEVRQYRKKRLVSKDAFLKMAKEDDTIILDTRSKAAFDIAHINGAVHLNFSDFTEDKLAKVIGSKDTRILIYCNNNFTDNVGVMMLKRIELALNVPTFINLYGYGYKNVYELKDAVSIHDPQMQIVATIRD